MRRSSASIVLALVASPSDSLHRSGRSSLPDACSPRQTSPLPSRSSRPLPRRRAARASHWYFRLHRELRSADPQGGPADSSSRHQSFVDALSAGGVLLRRDADPVRQGRIVLATAKAFGPKLTICAVSGPTDRHVATRTPSHAPYGARRSRRCGRRALGRPPPELCRRNMRRSPPSIPTRAECLPEPGLRSGGGLLRRAAYGA